MDRGLLELHARIEQEHWWFTGRRVILERVIERYLPPPVRLLDIGCGTGGNLAMLGRHGEAVGVDTSPFAVEAAGDRSGLPVHLGSLPDALPPDLGRFDGVCLFDILEHLEDDHAALVRVRDLLVPRGLIVITVPALPWLWSRHDLSFGHKRRYLRPDLERVIAAAGLELVHCTYFCSFLLPPLAVIRLTGRLLNLRGGTDFGLPSAAINGLLHRVFAAETRLVLQGVLGIGSSLLAVARL